MSEMFQTLGRLVDLWWRSDRIRSSPSEGRLLRLKSGDLLQIGPIQAEVLTRSVIDSDSGSLLCLICDTANGSAELSIDLTAIGNTTSIVWKQGEELRQMSEVEIEVWPRK